jgi:hypothetical protein
MVLDRDTSGYYFVILVFFPLQILERERRESLAVELPSSVFLNIFLTLVAEWCHQKHYSYHKPRTLVSPDFLLKMQNTTVFKGGERKNIYPNVLLD